ncbi:hypothetical protein VTH06DRAFT_618 [Thermothelomyces fergusii]
MAWFLPPCHARGPAPGQGRIWAPDKLASPSLPIRSTTGLESRAPSSSASSKLSGSHAASWVAWFPTPVPGILRFDDEESCKSPRLLLSSRAPFDLVPVYLPTPDFGPRPRAKQTLAEHGSLDNLPTRRSTSCERLEVIYMISIAPPSVRNCVDLHRSVSFDPQPWQSPSADTIQTARSPENFDSLFSVTLKSAIFQPQSLLSVLPFHHAL